MPNKLQISIPTPCHENWQDMTVADKGRFCASCKKHVIDFTTSSDRQIADAFKKEANLCGRFSHNQLNRDLVIPREKSSLWIAASAAIIGFLGVGNNIVFSQTLTEQAENKRGQAKKIFTESGRLVTGLVTDSQNYPIPEAKIVFDSTNVAFTDMDGKFSIYATEGDTLSVEYVGFEKFSLLISSEIVYNIILKEDYDDTNNYILVGAVAPLNKRSFFGRIFHSIGNIFH
jgi:hypothetical protein